MLTMNITDERTRDAMRRAADIKLLLTDCDGVLTDGKILLHADGTESKTFDIKDGTAIVWAVRAGLKIGFLPGRVVANRHH